jgi:glycosyltransferase involved in cell wall biosynthesis
MVNGSPDDSRSTPSVTVVIPTYNYAAVLAYAIASVLDQTYRDFELLVVGDGCTDDSEHVAAATGDARVQWVNLPENTGHQSAPNNEGLRRGQGAVIAYLGHDDLWLPHHLDVLMEAFDQGATAAHTTAIRAGPGGPCYASPPPEWSYTRGEWIPPTSLAIRRSHAVAVGGWRDAKSTGYLDPEADLIARIYDVAGPPRWVPRVTCIKLAAAERRNVYRTRPTHEQAYWLEEIRAADDPERAITAHVGRPYDLAGDPIPTPESLHVRVWRSARFRIRKHLRLTTAFSARTRLRRKQRYKGSR